MKIPDYYEILGVHQKASPVVIAAAYRALAKEHHPDAGGDAEQFKLIAEANEVLSDPARRSKYDALMARAHSTNGNGSKKPSESVREYKKRLRDERERQSEKLTDLAMLGVQTLVGKNGHPLVVAALETLRDDLRNVLRGGINRLQRL